MQWLNLRVWLRLTVSEADCDFVRIRFIVAVANSLLNPFGFIEYFLSGTAAKKPLGQATADG